MQKDMRKARMLARAVASIDKADYIYIDALKAVKPEAVSIIR